MAGVATGVRLPLKTVATTVVNIAASLMRSRNPRRIDGSGVLARRAPVGCAWRSPRPHTSRAIRRRPCCTGSYGTISRRSARTPRRCVTARGSRGCRAGVPRLPAVRMSGRRLRPLSVRRLRTGSSRGLFVQRSRLLPAVRRTPDGRAVGASRRSRVAGCAGSTMGVKPAASAPVPARVGSRSVWDGNRHGPARGAWVPAASRPATRPRRWPEAPSSSC